MEQHPAGKPRFPFTAFPTGWFRIAASTELRRGQALPLSCLGREFVLFRGEDGEPAALDAHCPHLGAHLGHGRVRGNDIECPFHHWRIGRSGSCTAVPGGSANPARARTAPWTLREMGGSLYLWFHPDRAPPAWRLPELAERTDRGWTRFALQKPIIVRTHVQELAENGVDLAHFAAVHASQIARVKTRQLRLEGPFLVHQIDKTLRLFGQAGRLLPATDGFLEFAYSGLGMVVCRSEVLGFPRVEFLTVIHLLPLDEEHVRLQAEFSMRRRGLLTLPIYAVAAREARKAFTDDTTILATKAYLPRPRLSDNDGPIMPFRKWAQQFYNAPQVRLAEAAGMTPADPAAIPPAANLDEPPGSLAV